MAQAKHFSVNNAMILDNNNLMLECLPEWQQEQIPEIVDYLLHKLPDAEQIEAMSGADRASVRLRWQQQIWLLQFECLSQSCWLECETNAIKSTTLLLAELKTQLML